MHAGGPSILADISNVASEAYNDHFNLVCMCRDTNAQDRIDSRKTATGGGLHDATATWKS
jgi:hypothetical protein